MRRGIVIALIGLALEGCHSGQRRESFEIFAYRFAGGKVTVASQRPGDPGCYTTPRLEAVPQNDELHLRVTYIRTDQKFCITPCPVDPLTQSVAVPSGAAGLPVVLDHPDVKACGPTTGGPAVVPPG